MATSSGGGRSGSETDYQSFPLRRANGRGPHDAWYVLIFMAIISVLSFGVYQGIAAATAPDAKSLASLLFGSQTPASAPLPGFTLSPGSTPPVSASPQGATPQPGVTPGPGEVVHVIAPGDTLYKLAQQYKTTAEAIMAANHIADPRRLHVGDRIVIPSSP